MLSPAPRRTPPPPLAALALWLVAAAGCGAAAGPGGPTGAAGSPCGSAAGCPGGVCLPLGGGYCSSDCATAACPAGSVCLPREGGHFCFVGCTDPAGCRAGFQCLEGGCLPACTGDGDCPGGLACSGGRCLAAPGAAAGQPCGADGDCSSRYCEPVAHTCQVRCAREDDCLAGQTCFDNPVDTDGNGVLDSIHPVCAAARDGGQPLGSACTSDGQCRLGHCQYGLCSLLCLAYGAGGGCPAPTACQKAFAVLDEGAPPLSACLPTTGNLDLSLSQLQYQLGVPERAVSLALWVENANRDHAFFTGLATLGDADGPLFDIQTDFYQNPLRYLPAGAASTALVSNSPLVKFKPGTVYTFGAFSEDRYGTMADFILRARIRLSSRPTIDSGRMRVHVFLTNLAGGCYRSHLAADNAHQVLGAFEQKMQSIFAQAGITIDEWKYSDTKAASQITLMNYASSDLDTLLRTATAGDTPDTAEIVLVRHIDDPTVMPGYEVLGVAGGIPAASGLPGTVHSGAAVSLSSLCLANGQTELAITAAHELGHTLGLYHTVESDKVHTDQMTDTKSDGTKNLMFWSEGSAVGRLSPQQSAAILKNPLLRD